MTARTESGTSTLSQSETESDRERARVKVPQLILALSADRPLGGSHRIPLEKVSGIFIGRGSELRISELRLPDGTAALDVRVPDSRMSSEHARLTRVLGHWVVEDANSKNGVFLNAVPQRRAALTSGDVIELGQTFLLYAERLVPSSKAPPPPRAASPREGVSGLATFVPTLARELESLVQVAASKVPVVLQGETGTGKEVAARAVHALSGRSGPFIAVNCGALAANLIETELFGYKKGAFTGAVEDRPGLIRSSGGGTLFLDEIGELSLPLQVAFLRVLEEGEVTPVGATAPVKVDLRVVAATHRELAALVERGEFRGDLYARLSGFTVRLPPLRQRREDLGLLICTLLHRLRSKGASVSLSRDAARALFRYPWPLNVRELEKALALALVLAPDGRIELEHLPPNVQGAAHAGSPEPRTLPSDEPEEAPADDVPLRDSELQRRDALIALLRTHHGNISAVAREMGLARMQIQRWLKRYRLDAQSFRA